MNREEKIKNYVKENNIDKQISFLGTMDRKEVIKEIFDADISVLTSYFHQKINTVITGAREYLRDPILL